MHEPITFSSKLFKRDRGEMHGRPLTALHHGLIVDWELAERMWTHSFQRILHVDPTEHAALVSESPLASLSARETTFELFFESIGVPGLATRPTSSLALMGAKACASTALVVNIGDNCTTVTPVIDGVSLTEQCRYTPVGGAHVSERLGMLLADSVRGSSAFAVEELSLLKHSVCEVASSTSDPLLSNQGSSLTYSISVSVLLKENAWRYLSRMTSYCMCMCRSATK